MTNDTHKTFLKLTFDGGRFARHTAPVEALAELATVQLLVDRVARGLYRQKYGRQRVPRGFGDAAKLHVSSTSDNCFSFELERVSSEAWTASPDELVIFEEARDVTLSLLEAGPDAVAASNFPPDALGPLLALGKKLQLNEALLLATNAGRRSARVDQQSRKRLAQAVNKPLLFEGDLEGEVEAVDDASGRAVLRSRDGERIELTFTREQRGDFLSAMQKRPAVLVHLQGTFVAGSPLKTEVIEEPEFRDDPRLEDIEAIWTRLDTLRAVPAGWLGNNYGHPPSESALTSAREVLAHLLANHHGISRPSVFPTPEGGIQAEWIFQRWAVDAHFAMNGSVFTVEATNADTGEDREVQFSSDGNAVESANALAHWLIDLTTSGEAPRVH